jgi:hypothetical protein
MFLQVLALMGRVFLQTFTSPFFISIYLGLILLVAWQYQRLYHMSEHMVNMKLSSYLKPTLISALLGWVGAMVGSVLLVFVGIDLGSIAILPLWLVALLLMFINPRFLCFAYAGGVLALVSLFTGYPAMSVSALLGLIAVLHMIESLLILLNGHLNPVPVYIQVDHSLRGGFNLQKFWPLPLVALASAGVIGGASGINMPDWWPLLRDSHSAHVSYMLVPILAVLGYGEISTTRTPKLAARRSALHLFIYSLLLLGLTVLSSYHYLLIYLSAIFSPVGHELVIWLGLRAEKNQVPLYVKPPAGITVLDVVSHTPAARCGLQSGDIVTGFHGQDYDDFYSLKTSLVMHYGPGHLAVVRDGKNIKLSYYSRLGEEPGIIPAPPPNTLRFLIQKDDIIFGFFRRWWIRLQKFTLRN